MQHMKELKNANAHLAHLQAPTHKPTASACKRAKFLPTHNMNLNEIK